MLYFDDKALSNEQTLSSNRNLLLGIWSHLSTRRRIQLGILLLVMIFSGGAELVSLGAVLPFLGILSDPTLLWKQTLVQELASQIGITSAKKLVLPVTLIFAMTTIFAALVRLVNLWLNGKLAAAVGSDLSLEAYRRTLYQPYKVHVQRNSAEVIVATTRQIAATVSGLNALLQLFTSLIVAIKFI